MVIAWFDQLDLPRIHHYEFLALVQDLILDHGTYYRMVFCGVGTDNEEPIALGISLMEFVIAPEPNTAARPATVELCQRRAQWSMLFVPTTALMNFCIR